MLNLPEQTGASINFSEMLICCAIHGKARSVIGLVFLAIWAISILIAMIFPIDPEGALPTTAGKIHKSNGPVAFLCLTLGVLLVSSRFKHDENMRPLHPTALILSLIMLFVFMSVGISFGIGLHLEGMLQRIYLTVLVTWFLLILWRLGKAARKI